LVTERRERDNVAMAGKRDLIEYLKQRGLDLEDDRQMEATCSLLAEDLSGEDLHGADLSGLSMRECNLSGGGCAEFCVNVFR
jgi:hypothetical protein